VTQSQKARIDSAVTTAIASGATPGAALVVGRGERVVFEGYYGFLAKGEPPVTRDTVYDLSSLTKPLATLACVLRIAAANRLSLSAPLHTILPEFTGDDRDARRGDVTLRDALAHCAGLPARKLYFDALAEIERRDGVSLVGTEEGSRWILTQALTELLVDAPGRVVTYSDVGYIVLGGWLERVTGLTLDRVFSEQIAAPLSLGVTGFMRKRSGCSARKPVDIGHVAPTDRCAWRGRVIRGEVQDENAYAMGGVAGHAGLFSSAVEVHRLVAAFVRSFESHGGLFDHALVRQCWAGAGSVVDGSTWSLGWDTPTPGGSSAGEKVSSRAFGHLGFTGTSIWVDLDRGVHVVLLTNRVHPDKENLAIREMRPRVHDAVFETVDRDGW